MRKEIIKILSIIMIVFSLVGCGTQTDTQKDTEQEQTQQWKNEYTKIVQTLESNQSDDIIGYSLIYITDDEIPELVAVFSTYERSYQIYNYVNGKVYVTGDGSSTELSILDNMSPGAHGCEYYYFEKENQIAQFVDSEVTYYKLNENYEFENQFSVGKEIIVNGDSGSEYYYMYKGGESKEITQDEYLKWYEGEPNRTAISLEEIKYVNAINILAQLIDENLKNNNNDENEMVTVETETEEISKEEAKFVISQIDVSEYPKVRVYFHLEDLNGNYLENMNFGNSKIHITEANGNSTKADIVQQDQIKQKNISFVIDISGSMLDGDKYIYARNAISTLLDDMEIQGDYAASLLAFNNTQNLLEDFSMDYTNLRSELASVSPNGGTAFWDSLELALIKANTREGQKCVIAATDGLDNSSRTTKENVIALSKQLQIPIYVIAFDETTANTMGVFAQDTGGACFTINNISDLKTIYQTIFKRQENQMMFEFVSDGKTDETDRGLDLVLQLENYRAETTIQYHKVDELYANVVTNDIIVSVEASSHLEEYYQSTGHLYHVAENVLDGSYRTAWVENAPGNGVGEWIQLNFDSNHAINGIEISNGYKKSESLYAKNSRAKRIRLYFSDDSSQEFDLEDEFMGIQRLQFNAPVVTNYIRIELVDMYQGTKYEDTCITELSVY